jgi:hypothetical protein
MKRLFLFLALISLSVIAQAETTGPQIQQLLESKKPILQHVKTIGDWEIFKKIENEKITCHAMTVPYRTKAYESVRDVPSISFTYKGPRQYTLSVNTGFAVDRQAGLILETNRRSHILDTNLLRSASTFSSIQDVAIINDMVKDGQSLSIRSYSTNDETALDFYSLKGLFESLNFLEKNCKTLQTY